MLKMINEEHVRNDPRFTANREKNIHTVAHWLMKRNGAHSLPLIAEHGSMTVAPTKGFHQSHTDGSLTAGF